VIAFDGLAENLGLKRLVPSPLPVAWVGREKEWVPALAHAVVVAERGHAGLAHRLQRQRGSGVFCKHPEPELIEACRRHGLGLAVLPPWSEIAEIAREAQRRALDACFPRLLTLGPLVETLEGLAENEARLVETLHRWTRLPVALVAPWGERIAGAGPVPPELPERPGESSRHLALPAGEALLVAWGSPEALTQARGFLHLAAQVLTAKNLLAQAQRVEEEGLRAALLDDLLERAADERRAMAFGFLPELPYVLALAEPPPIPGEHRLAEERRRRVLQELRHRAAAYLSRLGTGYLVTARAGRAVVLWQTHAPEREAAGLASALGSSVRIGYSARHRPLSEVPAAYREALIALKASGDEGPAGFEQLDPVAWVLLQQSREDLRALVERFLPLEEKLIRTLEVYLAHGGRAEAAAEALHVHPNTLRYRLAKIEQALGGSLRDPQTLAQIHLALRARALLDG